ncbi:MAG: hypothetical protein J6Y70_01525 [Bacilli bacterium]|nr:hypothetical protein [Bacilli bacterium]
MLSFFASFLSIIVVFFCFLLPSNLSIVLTVAVIILLLLFNEIRNVVLFLTIVCYTLFFCGVPLLPHFRQKFGDIIQKNRLIIKQLTDEARTSAEDFKTIIKKQENHNFSNSKNSLFSVFFKGFASFFSFLLYVVSWLLFIFLVLFLLVWYKSGNVWETIRKFFDFLKRVLNFFKDKKDGGSKEQQNQTNQAFLPVSNQYNKIENYPIYQLENSNIQMISSKNPKALGSLKALQLITQRQGINDAKHPMNFENMFGDLKNDEHHAYLKNKSKIALLK